MAPTIHSRNPATGDIIGDYPFTPPEQLPDVFARARAAQIQWAHFPVKKRAQYLLQIREAILNHLDEILDLIVRENGKPRFEALTTEVGPTILSISHYAKRAPHVYADKKLSSGIFGHRNAYLNYWPYGVVTVISPWNYPFYLPMADIIAAILAGNAVVFKPSEVTSAIGLKIQEIINEAALPKDLLQTVLGDASVGEQLLAQKPDKIFFTGGTNGGRAIALAAAKTFTPVTLELGGKNALVVLSDADVDFASSAALWGGFANSGQVCGATSRILVHEKLVQPFLEQLKAKLLTLRSGDPHSLETDLGAATSPRQKEIYRQQLDNARAAGAQIVAGGTWDSSGNRLEPTVIFSPQPTQLAAYNEETFGPVVIVTAFRTTSEAVDMVNSSRFGLTASIVSRNLPLAEQIAKQLHVGTVMINEVIFTAGAPEVPWGGIKESGIGVRNSDLGLLEFVRVRHINRPKSRAFSFKSPVWFPYTAFQFEFFKNFLGLYRIHWTDKLKAFPHFLMNLVKLIKFERRL